MCLKILLRETALRGCGSSSNSCKSKSNISNYQKMGEIFFNTDKSDLQVSQLRKRDKEKIKRKGEREVGID